MAGEDEILPIKWLHKLFGQLMLDQPRMVLMDRYYRGNHPLPFVPRVLKTEYAQMLARSRSNFMRMVVDIPAQRLKVQGFRSPGSERADAKAWDVWKAMGMDLASGMAITDSMSMGRSYLSVWRKQGADLATIQVEDPRSVIVAFDQTDRRRRVAALRLWVDDWTGNTKADVWLPDGCYSYTTTAKTVAPSALWPQSWSPAYPINDNEVAFTDSVLRESPVDFQEWSQQWAELGHVPNPSGEIPFVPLINSPSVLKQPDGESEIEDVYLSQDRINEMLFSRALAAWTTAYRQKWATGIDIPTDESGNPVQPFEAALDRLWASEDPGTKFGEFGQTDLKPFHESVEQDIQHIAVQKQLPRHYFQQQGQDPSGDAMKSAESGLIGRVIDKQLFLGAGFSEAMRLVAVMNGAQAEPLEVVWADPEKRTMGEMTDAIIKQVQAQLITRRVAQERLGYSPSEIARMDSGFAQEGMVREAQELLAPPPELPAGDDGVEV